ncbi:uncharacterized protein METZ01_LOCUS40902 [marine metagenome]|uniref:DinB-like domain-containing protein n=1 Tax=marine metagenome TaxID=408172 RepID=A0A381RAS5_9ZZZZ
MATAKLEQLESIQSVKSDLLAALVGMDYCLDWKQDPSEWSARELVYHVLDTPPGGAHNLVNGIITGDIKEYEIWSDRTNMTPERAGYDIDQVNSDIEAFFTSLDNSISGVSDEDLNGKTVIMHQRTRSVDEERTLTAILDRTLNGHMRDHLAQLQVLREALAI